MSQPTPDTRPDRQLVFASDEVMGRIAQQVQPQIQQPAAAELVRVTLFAYVFSWLPAFVVLAVATAVAPSATSGASVAATALWALQFATLIAISTVVTTLVQRRATPAERAGADTPPSRVLLRAVRGALFTVACAALVLAWQGLSVGQIAVLAGMIAALLHLAPMFIARLLLRRRQHGEAAAR
ncbi:hypothetical protein O7621_07870 [Solwaraspora sp. WMMD937]|uniref:hypothetical protein n=1 Tax=Solwaraspora sp. WMMD937 TaxID=3016090 RepID=UPI00249CC372|nr:hypothetical protein [Solwaraspora sp. WMMD937]WFE23211.1 hypothetical protein O7621_07870 [Solwaraspora sp. WMMD937]